MNENLFAKSGSVWYEQVDAALVNLLPTLIQVYNAEGVLTNVKTMVRTPTTDIEANYPCVTLSHINEKFNTDRDGRERFVSGVDSVNGLVTYEYPAQPYDLYYQIDLWAEYQTDANIMSMKLNALIGEHHVLNVVDTLGNARLSVMDKIDFANTDYIEEETNKRVFHGAYTYKIQVELDERLPEIINYAQSIEVSTNKL